jgi:hypothetical protein
MAHCGPGTTVYVYVRIRMIVLFSIKPRTTRMAGVLSQYPVYSDDFVTQLNVLLQHFQVPRAKIVFTSTNDPKYVEQFAGYENQLVCSVGLEISGRLSWVTGNIRKTRKKAKQSAARRAIKNVKFLIIWITLDTLAPHCPKYIHKVHKSFISQWGSVIYSHLYLCLNNRVSWGYFRTGAISDESKKVLNRMLVLLFYFLL